MTAPSPAALLSDAVPDDACARAPFAARCGAASTALLAAPLRRVLLRLVRRLACGSLDIALPDGRRVHGEGAAPGPHAAVVLHRWRSLFRLALAGDIGLAESYRDGDWSTPDLAALLELGIRNDAAWGDSLDAAPPWRWLFRAFHVARANTRRGSRHNVAFHYDLGNDFYRRWLDPQLIYSSALYADPAQPLEAAQAAKLARIAALLRLADVPGAPKVLEIGCGWGALALHLAGAHGAHVTGLTLSSEQLAHAQARVAADGAADRVDLRLQDYRDVGGEFDRIVSIEMMEAVGERYWPVYFATLRERLRPGGVAVVQVITMGDAHFARYRRQADFIQRFIFPGGMLPSPQAFRTGAERAGLAIVGDERFGASYAATLVEWRRRFLAAWPEIATLGFDASFKRLWEYYLCYCEAGFRAGRVDVGLYTLQRS